MESTASESRERFFSAFQETHPRADPEGPLRGREGGPRRAPHPHLPHHYAGEPHTCAPSTGLASLSNMPALLEATYQPPSDIYPHSRPHCRRQPLSSSPAESRFSFRPHSLDAISSLMLPPPCSHSSRCFCPQSVLDKHQLKEQPHRHHFLTSDMTVSPRGTRPTISCFLGPAWASDTQYCTGPH